MSIKNAPPKITLIKTITAAALPIVRLEQIYILKLYYHLPQNINIISSQKSKAKIKNSPPFLKYLIYWYSAVSVAMQFFFFIAKNKINRDNPVYSVAIKFKFIS